jgi:hypothetical protein
MRLLCSAPGDRMELKSPVAVPRRPANSGRFVGDIVTFRSALEEAFYFFAYRSFIAAVLVRIVIILAVFTLFFANHAHAQQAQQNSPPFPYFEFQIGGTPTIGDRN